MIIWLLLFHVGTFGSSDFIHSLLGEATDHIVRPSLPFSSVFSATPCMLI